MAFVLTAFKAYATETDEPLTSRFNQAMLVTGTGANTDVSLDISNVAGTFWTAVSATATGAAALKAYKDIILKADQFLGISGDTILAKNRVTATPSSGEYVLAIASHGPTVTFAATNAPTTWTYVLQWKNLDGQGTVKAAASV